MNTKRRFTKRSGLTLLELVIASSMLAVLMTSLSAVLRTARVAWETSDGDYSAMHHASTIARHLVREAREARKVTYLSPRGSEIELELSNGSTIRWSHKASSASMTDVVLVSDSKSGTTEPIAHGIRNLSFVGYKADAKTVATNIDDIQLIEVQVTVDTPSASVASQTVSSIVWIRAW
ncbi:MAG: hypothetical protein Aurels2KO_37640 [Aureliella sp.]